ncbi:FAD-binding oxidoreductase [Aureimonas flava]|uniref:FAD-binding oxidoreductase n=1 Tax=Aureimonas flava TaxID=2320271 RepID=A0A3A1WLY6_9HYPH|nr:FAD-binding oxidoreductase [Aureimonas flava]RIY02567.1 FAD-binding oxidoreductase [Aureimonas flava]
MSERPTETDVIVIGGGIAGAGCAFALSAERRVVLLERETQHGYHATGRSAASFTENYGTTVIRKLAIASRGFLENPPAGFTEVPLIAPCGMITIARADQRERLEEEFERGRRLVASLRRLTPAQAVAACGVLRPDYVDGAFLEPDSRELDVNALHTGFLRAAKARGADLRTGHEIAGLRREGDRWLAETPRGLFCAPVVVNAAGAWGDVVARMAGVAPIGLEPRRRTAFNIAAPAGIDMSGWPLINDVDEDFYFKRDAGQIFVSPADATPSEPCDAWAEDLDIAIGVERLQEATTIEVTRILHSWAGLRTFAPDGSPAVGFDPDAPGFFWLAGQGGYGIKTAVALSEASAGLILRDRLPESLERLGLDRADLAPARFRTGAQTTMETV